MYIGIIHNLEELKEEYPYIEDWAIPERFPVVDLGQRFSDFTRFQSIEEYINTLENQARDYSRKIGEIMVAVASLEEKYGSKDCKK